MFPIKTIMTTEVITVTAETPIYEALDTLMRNRISGMPVIDGENKVVGILSEKDVLNLLFDKKLDVEKTVGDYMSRQVVTFTEDTGAAEVCKFFITSHFRRIPIIREGKLAGIVSRRDILAYILEVKSKLSNMRHT